MQPSKTSALFFAAALALAVTSCRKDKTADASAEDTGYATDYAHLERSFDNAQDLADRAATDPGFKFKTTSQCATVTRDTVSNPRVLTIDFGPSNCLCNDGKYRRGKIIVKYTGRYADSGSRRDFSFDQYFINDNQLTGTKTVINMGPNSAGQPYFNISVNGALVLANGNGTRSWTSTRTRTWTAGYNTPAWSDNEYDISGNATLTRANGKTFNVVITTPLHRAVSCDWIQSGILEITPTGGAVRMLDFGNGSCDSTATLTINGRTRTIPLP